MPQTEQESPLQVKNNAGGFSFSLDKWGSLERFLILGSDSGTYYVKPRNLTLDNAKVITKCLKEDAIRVVTVIRDISVSGRATSNDACIFATAIAIRDKAVTTDQAKYLVSAVCRIGTHILTLCDILKATGGWGRKIRSAVAYWYTSKDVDALSYQTMKYRNRSGWTHRDALRTSHPVLNEDKLSLARYLVGKEPEGPLPPIVLWYEDAKAAEKPEDIIRIISDAKGSISWEMLPTNALTDAKVWIALLDQGMPLGAVIRHLGKFASLGLFEKKRIVDKITSMLKDPAQLRKARIHPVAILKALKTYNRGQGIKGSLTWPVCLDISAALDHAFYLSFDEIPKTEGRYLLGIDISGSMSCTMCADVLTCAEGAAAMAMATFRSSENAIARGFSTEFIDLGLTKSQNLNAVLNTISNRNFGGTDCSLPMEWALKNKVAVDKFVVYTDNETYAGNRHPHMALKDYRKKMGINAKLIVVGMASNGFTIADPNDSGMLDCVGFDTVTPSVISNF